MVTYFLSETMRAKDSGATTLSTRIEGRKDLAYSFLTSQNIFKI